jgi:hypothetical protein
VTVEEILDFNPIKESFKDVTAFKLFVSTCIVISRIYRLQGIKAAVPVLPIVWTIIWATRGFSRYHAEQFEMLKEGNDEAIDKEERHSPLPITKNTVGLDAGSPDACTTWDRLLSKSVRHSPLALTSYPCQLCLSWPNSRKKSIPLTMK